MKHVKTVQNLVHKAYNYNGEFTIKRKGEEVYRAKRDGDFLHLWHYGTLILSVELPLKLVQWIGGYSNSDRDAINNTLHVLGMPQAVCRRGDKIILCS